MTVLVPCPGVTDSTAIDRGIANSPVATGAKSNRSNIEWHVSINRGDSSGRLDGAFTNTDGLGWGVSKRPDGARAVGHSGGQQRVSTFLHMQPDQGLAVVIMSNLEGARLGELSQQIGDIVLGQR